MLPEHVEDQQGQGLLHGRQAHHHARGGGEKQADDLQNIWVNIDLNFKDADKCQKIAINPNVKVTDCYGLHHLSTLKEERAPAIQKGFLFTCTCQVMMPG